MFAGSLAAMLGAGLSLARVLAVLERQMTNKRFKQIIGELSAKINRGDPLSRAMADFSDVFPPVFIAMVASGEESGKLASSLEVVRLQLSKSYDLHRRVKGAMIYPAIVVGVTIIIGVLMMIYLVPQLTTLFRDLKVELPLSTRIVIATSDFLSNHTISFLVSLLIVVTGIIKLVRTKRGKYFSTTIWLHTPGIGTIMRNMNAAVTMRTISSLLSSGVSMLESLSITSKVLQNPFYQKVIVEAGGVVEKGGPLSGVFKAHDKVYPVFVGEMTEVGEETGDLPGMLLKGALFFEDEVDQATKNLSTIIEPALMILIGIFVGFFAVSMLGPMYSLSNNI